jgi:hypothetical protein
MMEGSYLKAPPHHAATRGNDFKPRSGLRNQVVLHSYLKKKAKRFHRITFLLR